MFRRIAVFLAICFACECASGQKPAAPVAEVAATVNGESILVADVDAAIDATLVSAALSARQRRELRLAVVEDLIDDAVLRQFLAKNAAKVQPAEIEAQMTALRANLARENQSLAAFLRQQGLSEAKLRADWAMQIQLANYVKQQATDDKLKAYHAANRDHFDKVEVEVCHILIRCGKNATPAERAAVREKLQVIRNELARGALTFSEAAKLHSQCPSARKGGNLSYIRRRGLPEDEPLAKAAFALKVGALSEIVETDRGFHLLTVTNRKPGTRSEVGKCVIEVLEAFTDDYRVELVSKLRKEAEVKRMIR